MTKFAAGALLLLSTPLMAHDINTDACDVNINAGVKINSQTLSFYKDDRQLYQIIGAHQLIVDGEEVSLSASQEKLVNDYSTSIRAVVPQVKSIAIEGISLATEGVNLAFNELLGEDNDIGRELTEELNKMSAEIDKHFSVERGIEFNEDGFVGEDIFGEDFEQRIEDTVERAVQSSMGSLLMAVGREMMFSGGDMEAFETRMENFGSQIEQQMETRASAIEAKADEVCLSVLAIDQLESAMQREIPELAEFNLIEVRHKDHKKAYLQ
ncbi:DUF2884 family protein [Colwellia sp. MEBiC06753]